MERRLTDPPLTGAALPQVSIPDSRKLRTRGRGSAGPNGRRRVRCSGGLFGGSSR